MTEQEQALLNAIDGMTEDEVLAVIDAVRARQAELHLAKPTEETTP